MTIETDQDKLALEYEKVLEYIFHLYDTRHKIFHFYVLLNTGMLAVVLQYLQSMTARLFMSGMALIISVTLFMMAYRSWQYLTHLESHIELIEQTMGLSAFGNAAKKMPGGMDSTKYLFVVYTLFSLVWLSLTVVLGLAALGIEGLEL